MFNIEHATKAESEVQEIQMVTNNLGQQPKLGSTGMPRTD
jgi:hypothetical protein